MCTKYAEIVIALPATFGLSPSTTGIVLVVLTGAVILDGIKRIGQVTQLLVPFMALFYLGGGIVILVMHAAKLPEVFALVFESAFSGTAAAGGFAGSTVAMALRYGIARGPFSNEAGLGSAPIVHAAADTDRPVRQGLYGVFEVFVDTLLICTVTGLVILVTDTWTTGATGAALSVRACEAGLPGTWGDIVVTGGLILFAYSTVIGWSYYGETGVVYLFGAVGLLHLVWGIADTLNGLMAIPNLIAVPFSIPLLPRLQKEFFSRPGKR